MNDDEKKAAETRAQREEEGAYFQHIRDRQAKTGYVGPRVNGRYQKGYSGNPNGRPVKTERAHTARQNFVDILRAGEDELEIITNGRREKVSAFEIALKKLHVKAAQGDMRAIIMVMEIRRDALRQNEIANRRLHNVVDELEERAIMNGHFPANHEFFKQLNYWRKRTRKF